MAVARHNNRTKRHSTRANKTEKASSTMGNSITGCLRLSGQLLDSDNEALARPVLVPKPFRKVPRQASVGATKVDKDDVVSRWPAADVSKIAPSFANPTT